VRETGGTERGSLREIRRLLRPGGLFLCYHLPNRRSAVEAVARWVPSSHSHEFRFDATEIAGLLEDANLELVELARYAILPRNSLGQLPRALAQSRWLACIWSALDGVLSFVFRRWCQNYLFVARRPVR
jgi:hypothetical protein